MLIQTKDCPWCHERVGWWVRMNLNYDQFFNPDGSSSHAEDNETERGKQLHCYNCNHVVTHCVEDKEL